MVDLQFASDCASRVPLQHNMSQYRDKLKSSEEFNYQLAILATDKECQLETMPHGK